MIAIDANDSSIHTTNEFSVDHLKDPINVYNEERKTILLSETV